MHMYEQESRSEETGQINAPGRVVRRINGGTLSRATRGLSTRLPIHFKTSFDFPLWSLTMSIKNAVFALCVMFVSFVGTSAAFAATDAGGLEDLARPLFDAVMSGHYAYAASCALVLLVAVARKWGKGWWPWLGGDAGGSFLVLLGSFGGALATALAGGGPVSLALVWTACKVAAGASGGYTLIKRLLVPALRRMVSKLPKALQKPFNMLLWVFDGGANARADKAGDAAVKANPSNGVSEITGTPRDVP